MANDTVYYYMRLKDDFFDDDRMKLLESMPDGFLYQNILLKMYVKSLKSNGRLAFNDYIPYNTKMLATITNHHEGVVEKALDVLKQLELIEILDNGAIYMLEIQNYIGKSSNTADRKRAYRALIEEEKKESTKEIKEELNKLKYITDNREYMYGQMSDKCPSQSKNNRKIIPPTLEMVKSYCLERGNSIDAENFINFYESKGWLIGKNKMKDWQAAIRTWESKMGFVYKEKKQEVKEPLPFEPTEDEEEMSDEEWLKMMENNDLCE